MISYKDELYHHGIKGQKWGVRRYRNADGTLTEAGKQRYGDEQTYNKQHKKDIAKKVAIGLGIAAAAGLTIYAIKNPGKAGEFAANVVNKAQPKLKELGKTTMKNLSESASKAGKAATDAVLAVAAATAVSNIAQKYDTSGDPNDPNTIRNKMIVESSTAALNTFATSATSGTTNNKSNNGASVGKEVTSKLGSPNNKPIDRSSTEYQSLFKEKSGNNRSDTVRSTIKGLSKQGYGIDQIQSYLDMVDRGQIKHSDLDSIKNYVNHQVYLSELYHHGIKGQKWGVRRYQNALMNGGYMPYRHF